MSVNGLSSPQGTQSPSIMLILIWIIYLLTDDDATKSETNETTFRVIELIGLRASR